MTPEEVADALEEVLGFYGARAETRERIQRRMADQLDYELAEPTPVDLTERRPEFKNRPFNGADDIAPAERAEIERITRGNRVEPAPIRVVRHAAEGETPVPDVKLTDADRAEIQRLGLAALERSGRR